MVAAQYLLYEIESIDAETEVRLFEGFVSFKPRGAASDHSKDVELLRQVVQAPDKYKTQIVDPKNIRVKQSDTLQSAFLIMGRDYGIPPLIAPHIR